MSDFIDDLHLTRRAGLPDTVAWLRPGYPRSTWPQHANYGELAAFWRGVHDSLRREADVLAQLTGDFRAERIRPAVFQHRFMPQLTRHLQHLDGHHRIEDGHYFPRFRALDDRFGRGFDLLENDHDVIHRQLLQVAESAEALLNDLTRGPDAARRAADRYADDAERLLRFTDRHLIDEEDLVIPAMLEHGERALKPER